MIAERNRSLIAEGREVAKLERHEEYLGTRISDRVVLHAWLIKVEYVVVAGFGNTGVHCMSLRQKLDKHPNSSNEIHSIIGVPTGALDDLENGYLAGQELVMAADLFENVLEQAEHLLANGSKDPAAILGRVVLEDPLRRLATASGVDSRGKAANLNDNLSRAGRFAKPRWRRIQAWLDIGHSTAHGQSDAFTSAEVAVILSGIRDFTASEFPA